MKPYAKHALCVLALLLTLAAPLSARGSIELSFNFYATAVSVIPELKSEELRDLTSIIFKSFNLGKTFGVGFRTEANFFFGSPTKHLDLGLHTAFDTDGIFGTTVKAKTADTKLDNDRNDHYASAGGGAGISLGFAVRLNTDERTSFLFVPAVRGKVRLDTSPVYDFAADADAALSVGFRRRLKSHEHFDLALALGWDFSWPVIGALVRRHPKELEAEYLYTSGFEMRLSAGVVFNFVTRSSRIAH